MSMIDDVLSELKQGIEKAKEALRRELTKLRTGRAHPGMLENIRVDYYGQSTPISQMATVNVPEPRMLTVKPWDKSQVQAVEKAIRESNLGLNPQVDSELIRIPIPALSEERALDRGPTGAERPRGYRGIHTERPQRDAAERSGRRERGGLTRPALWVTRDEEDG